VGHGMLILGWECCILLGVRVAVKAKWFGVPIECALLHRRWQSV